MGGRAHSGMVSPGQAEAFEVRNGHKTVAVDWWDRYVEAVQDFEVQPLAARFLDELQTRFSDVSAYGKRLKEIKRLVTNEIEMRDDGI